MTSTANLAIAKAKAKGTRRQQTARTKTSGDAFRTTWAAAWKEGQFDTRICPAWTAREFHAIKTLATGWYKSHGDLHAFLAWAVTHWKQVLKAKFAWMTANPPPTQPSVFFLVKFKDRFIEAYSDKATIEWIGTLPGTAEEVARLIDRGMSPEAARLEVAKAQALSADRKGRAAEMEAARVLIRAAELAKRRGAPRFNAANPHPRAAEMLAQVKPLVLTNPVDLDAPLDLAPLPPFKAEDWHSEMMSTTCAHA